MTYQEAYQEILQMEEEIKLLANRQKQEEDILAVKKAQAEEQKSSYYKELTDVEKLEKMTLTKLFAKISGSYEEKHEKEYQEYITAKRRRDEWNYEIEEQKNLISRYRNDITRMTAECRAKKRQLRENYPEGQALAAEEEEKRRELLRKKKELSEAIDAANRVLSHAKRAVDLFSDADSWATWDVFSNNGIVSHMAKYSALDDGMQAVHQMQAAANWLEKELKDVEMVLTGEFDAIDDSTRVWDYWFDNIFTDWSVKERIQENLNQTKQYCHKLERLISDLRGKRYAVEQELKELE